MQLQINEKFKRLLDPLTQDELDGLEQSILVDGCRDPLVVWNGVLVDGHNRYKICTEYDIPFNVTEMDFDNEQAAFYWIINNQLSRRNITPEQVKYLRGKRYNEEKKDKLETLTQNTSPMGNFYPSEMIPENKQRTSQTLANEYGVSEKTIRNDAQFATSVDTLADKLGDDVRRNILGRDSNFTIDDVNKVAKIAASEPETAKLLIDKVATGEARNLAEAVKEVKAVEKATERAVLTESMSNTTHDDRLKLYHCGVLDLKQYVSPNSIDYIITDPPYPKEFLNVYSELADFAAYALKPGGSLLVMCGQSYFPDVLSMLSSSGLNYHWLLSYLTPGGQSPQIWQRKVNTFGKPVLWFVNGKYDGQWVGDVIKSDVNDNDKEHHYWGQSVSGMTNLVSRFVKPADIICDPFLGGGTTAKVALDLNCYFIGCDIDENTLTTTRARLNE